MNLVFTILSALLYLTTAQRTRCESFCRYRFCTNLLRSGTSLNRENRATTLGIPYDTMAGTPCIARPSGRLQMIANVTGGEATVSKEFSHDPFVPISEYRSDSVHPPIPSNFFQWVDNVRNGRESVGRIPPMGNQDEVLDQVCVRMPISSYNVLRRDGSVRRTVRPRGNKSCVGFRTQATQLLVSFEWSTPNDFDLHLVEPSGFEISRFEDSRTSPNGGHLTFDVGTKVCEVESGREIIRYLLKGSTVEQGTYTIRIDHTRLCWYTSPFRLRAFFKGKVILDESGDLMRTGQDVLVRTFTIPPVDEGVEDVRSNPEAVV